MEDLRRAIYHETFLQMYDRWQIGRYYSSRGLLKIEEMSTNHIKNAIKSLGKMRINRVDQIDSLVSDGNVVAEIKNSYSQELDIMSIKVRELQDELDFRDDAK